MVYQGIIEMTDPNMDIIAEKMCKSLSKIGTVCVKPLSECYAIDDLKQIRKSYILEAKKYLLSFKGDMSADALDNCKILDYTENLDDMPVSVSLDIGSDEQEEEEVTTQRVETTEVTEDGTVTTTERIPAKPSRSAELDTPVDLDTYDYAEYYKQYDISAEERVNHDDDDATDNAINNAVNRDNSDLGGEDMSTEAVERLPYRTASTSSGSRSAVIHSVIMLVPSLLFFASYFL